MYNSFNAQRSKKNYWVKSSNFSNNIDLRFSAKFHRNSGAFGKVIAICKDKTENIDLLRKTTLSILPIDLLSEMFSGFQNDDTKQFNLPELKTQISGPAVIVIPVAIYA